MDIRQHTVLRDWIALILILVVVPLSVFGGTNITCDSQGLSQTCAPQPVFSSPMVLISPLILMAAGVVAGMVTSGWTGLFVVGVGQIAGQVVIVAMSYAAGRPVPVDLFSGMMATLWFGIPIAIGYGLARTGAAILRVVRGPKSPSKDGTGAPEA